MSNKSITFAVEMKMMKETYQAPIIQIQCIDNLPVWCMASLSEAPEPGTAPAHPAPGHSA